MAIQLPVVQVTVHPDGAIVVRRGPAAVGDAPMRVGGLPLLLDPGSVRVGVRGGTLVQARVDLDLPDEHRPHQDKELDDLLDVDRRIAVHEAEVKHLLHARSFARELAPTFEIDGAPPTAAMLGAWAGLDTAAGAWSQRLDARRAELAEAHEALYEERRLLQAALERRSTEALWRRWAPTRCVALDIREPQQDLEIEVSYRIPGARWVPAYTLDLDRDLQGGRFAMRAMIAQATGEDWNDVAVALSTAPCARIVDLPELQAMRLGTVQPPAPSGWRPLPADLDSLFPQAPAEPPAPGFDGIVVGQIGTLDDIELEEFAVRTPAKSGGMLSAMANTATAILDAVPMPPRSSGPPGMAMPQSAPMPAPVAMPAAMPAAKPAARGLRARDEEQAFGGAQPQKPAAPSGTLQAGDDQLDYANLRVHGPDAGAGKRGRLHALGPADVFRDRELPPDAWDRWSSALSRLIDGTHELMARPLQPHQVVPGPIEGADVRFDGEGTVSIPSDGRFHTTTLFTEPATVKITYRAVPRSDPRVFRRVEARTRRPGALPPGPLEASIAGALEIVAPFVGAAGDAAVRFGLGAEDGITIVRNVRYDEQSAGMLGGSRRFSTAIEVEAASALDRPVRIEVLERIPVPVEKDVPLFQITDSSPPSEPYEGEKHGPILEGGRRQWLQLEPGGTARARLTYAVTLSNKEELAGGDRRG